MTTTQTASRFVTVTLNPAIDLSMSIERLAPTRKLRCSNVRRSAGGGGINVARVLARLGATVKALFLAGGAEGDRLCHLLEAEGVGCDAISIAGETRESFNVLEESTGLEFRFVLPGPEIGATECEALAERVARAARGAVVVMSGSLPPGIPASFYGDLAREITGNAARVVLDASGEALQLGATGVDLIKPSLDELVSLAGRPLPDEGSRLSACRSLIEAGRTARVALTMGAEGAMLVDAAAGHCAEALPLASHSAVGAGDSFLAGMLWAETRGATPEETLAIAVATPSAGLIDRSDRRNGALVLDLARTVRVRPI